MKIPQSPEKNCLIIEDALSGVKAASAAKCLAITSSFTPEQLHHTDYIVKNLATAPDQTLTWP